MALEIERKFLLRNDAYKAASEKIPIKQGYVLGYELISVRIRLMGDAAFLAIKSATVSATRQEFEYPVPLDDANEMLSNLCHGPIIEKDRYLVNYKGNVWEVDVFHGDNEGLVIAEIELDSEEQSFEKPDWIGEEVTADPRYYNVNLIKNPYKNW